MSRASRRKRGRTRYGKAPWLNGCGYSQLASDNGWPMGGPMALESIYGGATLSHSGLGSDGSRALYESQLLDEDIVSVVYDDRFSYGANRSLPARGSIRVNTGGSRSSQRSSTPYCSFVYQILSCRWNKICREQHQKPVFPMSKIYLGDLRQVNYKQWVSGVRPSQHRPGKVLGLGVLGHDRTDGAYILIRGAERMLKGATQEMTPDVVAV
ncbi:hypothetical protein BJ166DRAFT_494048 [Pestalotiopsis sp. NC0098]|nr:hypothetical protein BJ166DRAFT_494048 [Pestalotiopsis sp. NC0098]